MNVIFRWQFDLVGLMLIKHFFESNLIQFLAVRLAHWRLFFNVVR